MTSRLTNIITTMTVMTTTKNGDGEKVVIATLELKISNLTEFDFLAVTVCTKFIFN